MVNLYLIGFMGSGKSTIGKALAHSLNMQFTDLDAYIEAREGKTIASIFSGPGEQKFREIERSCLLQTFELKNYVISVGGGAPCFFDNMEQINLNGLSIYLQMSAEALLDRLWTLPPAAREVRPLLAGKTKEELGAFIAATLNARNPYYSKAKLIVDNNSNDMHVALERIKIAAALYQNNK